MAEARARVKARNTVTWPSGMRTEAADNRPIAIKGAMGVSDAEFNSILAQSARKDGQNIDRHDGQNIDRQDGQNIDRHDGRNMDRHNQDAQGMTDEEMKRIVNECFDKL